MRQPQLNLEEPLNPSSQIASIGHDLSAKVGVVGFKHRSGVPTFYHYKHVSQFQYETLRTADSPGNHLFATWKANPDKHPCHKVIEGQECDCFELTCAICGKVMNVADDPRSVDCGGDCRECMAKAGDPDAIFALDNERQ